ncbi:MAG: flagellar protein FliS [Desulfovibrio sp.]|nr:flagellar protein FliS [Desulfovibrio sp.]
MAKILLRQNTPIGKKASLTLATQDVPESFEQSGIKLTNHIKSILSLYAVCIRLLTQLRACLLDGRLDDALPYRKHVKEILHALDDDLDLSVELANNFHTLYQHCLHHIGDDDQNLPIENVDAVQMVVTRLRHLYVHLIEDSTKDKPSS